MPFPLLVTDEVAFVAGPEPAEVSRIVSWVGARSRGHAVALLVGAG